MATARNAAPGRLDVIRAFVNTRDVEDDLDELAQPTDLRRWLHSQELGPQRLPVSGAELERARAVREALRSLLLSNNGEPIDPDAVALLNEQSSRAGLAVRFDSAGLAGLEPTAGGVDGALGRLLAIVAGAMSDGSWSRLKACREHSCEWAFYDHSRNRSGAWCSMRVCGNRAKARAYRARRRPA